jgi:hypothetical protein
VEAGLHRSDRQAQDLRRLFVGESLEIAEGKHQAVFFRKLLSEPADHLPDLLLRYLSFDFTAPVLDRTRIRAPLGEGGQKFLDRDGFRPPSLAQTHQAGVHADPVDPGGTLQVLLETVRLPHDREEDIPCRFLGIVSIHQDRHGEAIHLFMVSVEEGFNRGRCTFHFRSTFRDKTVMWLGTVI